MLVGGKRDVKTEYAEEDVGSSSAMIESNSSVIVKKEVLGKISEGTMAFSSDKVCRCTFLLRLQAGYKYSYKFVHLIFTLSFIELILIVGEKIKLFAYLDKSALRWTIMAALNFSYRFPMKPRKKPAKPDFFKFGAKEQM